MTRRRWIADEVWENRAALVGAHGAHLARVLRAQVGQKFDVVADGTLRRGLIVRVDADLGRVEFELGEEVQISSSARVRLLLAVFKFDRMEWAIEKCTELGVTEIVPVIARRTESHLANASEKRVERWRRLALQASEQSRRVQVAEIADPVKLTSKMIAGAEGKRIVLSESEEVTTLKQVLTDGLSDSVTIAIGPEGGWTNDELEMFQSANYISASLGETILRAETAAIAAMAIVMSELGSRETMQE